MLTYVTGTNIREEPNSAPLPTTPPTSPESRARPEVQERAEVHAGREVDEGPSPASVPLVSNNSF